MHSFTQFTALNWAAAASAALTGYTLKIAPVGDSITAGARSSTHDGYRAGLVQLLDGNQVNMIGYRTSGAARDTQYQAHDGWFVNNIADHLNDTFPVNPNVYLLHGGTNDIQAYSYYGYNCSAGATICQDKANAYAVQIDRMANTGALVVVAQIIPGNNSQYHGQLHVQNIQVYNSYLEKVVRARDYPGTKYKIQLVNMQQAAGGVTLDDLSDDYIHPLDGGYAKMAKIWYAGLQNASANGLIPSPNATAGYPVETCSNPFSTNYTDGIIVQSRGVPNCNYYNTISCSDATDGSANCNCNDGGANFTVPRTGSCAEMSLGFVTAVRWADLNGDGRQENFRISPTGSINASLNLGTLSNASNNYTITGGDNNANTLAYTLRSRFRELGLISPIGVNTKPYQVRLADLDGDARAEFFIVQPNGTIQGFYNTGSMHTLDSNIAINWAGTPDTTVANSFGVSGVGVRLVDFNGDGKADYVWVSANGAVQVWLNGGTNGKSAAVTNWISQGSVGPAVLDGTKRENIVLADVDGDGRADYIIIDRGSGTAGCYLNKPPNSGSNTPQWQWIGALVSANQVKSNGGVQFLDEVNFADPDGDGVYDYLTTSASDCSVTAIRNACIPYSAMSDM